MMPIQTSSEDIEAVVANLVRVMQCTSDLLSS